MEDKTITVYGSGWCGDCRRARRFLVDRSIPFKWIDIERDQSAEQFVLKVNQGMRSIPTIVFGDGSILVEPSNMQLAHKLGIPLSQSPGTVPTPSAR